MDRHIQIKKIYHYKRYWISLVYSFENISFETFTCDFLHGTALYQKPTIGPTLLGGLKWEKANILSSENNTHVTRNIFNLSQGFLLKETLFL